MVKWIRFALDWWWTQSHECQESIEFPQSREQNLFGPLISSDGKKPVWKSLLRRIARCEEKEKDDKTAFENVRAKKHFLML